MRVMVMVKTTGAEEGQAAPSEELFAAMGAYNEELVKAGVMLDGEGLLPTSTGAKVVLQGGDTSVVDGPFTESKEIIGGYWIWEVDSFEEALEWAKRCPTDPSGALPQTLELRRIAEQDDYGDELTPELREKEQQLAEELRAKKGQD